MELGIEGVRVGEERKKDLPHFKESYFYKKLPEIL